MLTRGLERHIQGRSSSRLHPVLLAGTALSLFLASFLVGSSDGGSGHTPGLGRPAAASSAPSTAPMRFPGVPGIDLHEHGYTGTDLDRVTFDALREPLPGFPMHRATELRQRIHAGSEHLQGLSEAERILHGTLRTHRQRVTRADASRDGAVAELAAARAELAGDPEPDEGATQEAEEREQYAQLLVGMSSQELAVAEAEIAVRDAEARLVRERELADAHEAAFAHTAGSVDEAVRVIDHLRAQLADALGTMRSTGAVLAEQERGRTDIRTTRVEGFEVHHAIADSLQEMVAAARADGIDLRGKGYRPTERQIELREQNCGTTEYDIYEKPSGQCSPPTAKPHRSLHESGLAVDFRHGEEGISTRSSPAYRWLAANAHAYGFFNLPSEPWHWSVSGT